MAVIFPVPPIEARPGPLPDAGPFLRVFAGADVPTTVMFRTARELIGVWRAIYEQGRAVQPEVEEQLSLCTWIIDREAKGHLADGPEPAADATEHPQSYGEVVAWLAWKYVVLALRQHVKPDVDLEAYELMQQIEALDALVVDVRAGRVRLRLPDK